MRISSVVIWIMACSLLGTGIDCLFHIKGWWLILGSAGTIGIMLLNYLNGTIVDYD